MRQFVALLLAALLLAGCGGTPAPTVQTQSYTVQLALGQPGLGNQTATITIRDRAGQPVSADEVRVVPLMEAMGMASPETLAQPEGPGRYRTDQVYFSMSGDWELDVYVQRGGSEEVARFPIQVP